MKLNYFIALLLLCQLSFAQTAQPIVIPGTKYSLTPPSGFSLASNFSGFFNDDTGASIMVSEIPAPYSALSNSFTAEALKTRGMILIEKKPIKYNGAEATLFIVKQPANGVMYHKQILMFGDTENTVLVNGIYPEDAKINLNELKESLLSIKINLTHNENPVDAATFTLSIEGTDFKFVKNMAGSLLYSTDGKIPTNKPILIAANSIAKVVAVNRKSYAVERVKQLPGGENIVIKTTKGITIDNMDGYEIVAEGKTPEGKKELVYEVMLFNEAGDYYLILGQAAENMDKNLEVYRAIAKTFKRK